MPDPRFLVVRLGSLGDIVHTFPAVAALRQSFPAAQITWLTHPRWESLIASSGLATDIWAAETRSAKSIREIVSRIRTAKFTVAIDYQGLWKSAGLPLLGGISKRIGFSSQTIREWGVPILYTDRVRCTTTHIADQNGELSQRAGAANTSAPFTLQIPPQDDADMRQLLHGSGIDRYVLLGPGGGWRSKCWPPERFGQLCQQLRNSHDLRCVLNYGPGEDDLVQSIKTNSGTADPLAYSGSMGKLMALAHNALCIVGGDTGPLHLAVALGTPSVSIYGPTDPNRNGPYPTFTMFTNASPSFVGAQHAAPQLARPDATPARANEVSSTKEKISPIGLSDRTRNVVLRDPAAVRNHSRIDETDPAILKISVDEVFRAVDQLIGAAK
jgi:heptosyltransferase I